MEDCNTLLHFAPGSNSVVPGRVMKKKSPGFTIKNKPIIRKTNESDIFHIEQVCVILFEIELKK